MHVTTLVPGDRDRHLEGLLVFLDPPRADAAAALRRLGGLGIAVKGDGGLLFGLAVTVFVCSLAVLIIRRGEVPIIGATLVGTAR